MMLAGSSKGMLISYDQVIFPIKSVSISLQRVGTLGSSTLLEIDLKELEHLRPGFALYTARTDGLNIGYKGMRLVLINGNFIRDSSLVQGSLEERAHLLPVWSYPLRQRCQALGQALIAAPVGR